MLVLTAANMTTQENSLRSSAIMNTKLGKMLMPLHRLALSRFPTTLNSTMTGKRCMTVPFGSIQLPALKEISLVKPTK